MPQFKDSKKLGNKEGPREDTSLTQKGKVNSHQRWMEREKWVEEEVSRGRGRRKLGEIMKICGGHLWE